MVWKRRSLSGVALQLGQLLLQLLKCQHIAKGEGETETEEEGRLGQRGEEWNNAGESPQGCHNQQQM